MTADDNFLEVGEDFLAHFGKKGMKWGVRNTKGSYRTPKPVVSAIIDPNKQVRYSTKQIKAARGRQKARYLIAQKKMSLIESDKTTIKGRIALNNQLIKMQKEHVTGKDFHTSNRLTKGETFTAYALGLTNGAITGWFGLPIASIAPGIVVGTTAIGLKARRETGGRVKFVKVK